MMINTFEDSRIKDITLESNRWRDDYEYDEEIQVLIEQGNIKQSEYAIKADYTFISVEGVITLADSLNNF